jgi:hypothetical protein
MAASRCWRPAAPTMPVPGACCFRQHQWISMEPPWHSGSGCLKIACLPSFRISRTSARIRLGSWADPGGQSSRDRQRADFVSKLFSSVSISRTHNALFAAIGLRFPLRALGELLRTEGLGQLLYHGAYGTYPAPETSLSTPRDPEVSLEEVSPDHSREAHQGAMNLDGEVRLPITVRWRHPGTHPHWASQLW